MIMTSFYFSIGGLLALCLYGVSRCEKQSPKRRVFGFIFPTAAAVCLAGVLLVPTACALFARNDGSKQGLSVSLLFPDFSQSRFAYDGYGIGLTAAALVVLFVGITYKCRRDCFLSAACLALLVFPVFTWALNGGLYARDKALIPLLPALLFLAAVFLQKLKQNEIPSWNVVGGILLTVFFCFVSFLLHGNGIESKESRFLLYEAGCSVVFALLYRKCRYTVCLAFPSIICLVAYGIFCNAAGGHILEKQFYRQVTDSAWEKEISDLLANEQGLFRLEQGG